MASEDKNPATPDLGPLARAFQTWLQYAEAAEDLVHLTHEGLSQALRAPELFRILEMSDAEIKRAKWKAGRARREVDAGFPTLHAHSLLGLCGALECFVERTYSFR